MIDTLLHSAALPVDGGERPHLNASFDLDQLDEAAQREEERLRASSADWYQLTDDQRHQLDHFNRRQPERQVYLHSLASDPQILASQAVGIADISSRRR